MIYIQVVVRVTQIIIKRETHASNNAEACMDYLAMPLMQHFNKMPRQTLSTHNCRTLNPAFVPMFRLRVTNVRMNAGSIRIAPKDRNAVLMDVDDLAWTPIRKPETLCWRVRLLVTWQSVFISAMVVRIVLQGPPVALKVAETSALIRASLAQQVVQLAAESN